MKKESKLARWCDENEYILFRMKFFILIPVVISIIISIVFFIIGTVDFIDFFIKLCKIHTSEAIEKFYINILSVVDIFLFGIIMIIFGFGIYNLFISKLDNVERDNAHNTKIIPNWIQFNDLSELKALLFKVIILIIAIFFLQKLIEIDIKDIKLTDLSYLLIFPISAWLFSLSVNIMEKK